MSPGDLSDDELLTMLRTPEDSVRRQRARSGRTRPAPNDARLGGLSDEELLAALRQAPAAAAPRQPAYQSTDYSGGDPTAGLGPSTDANLDGTARARVFGDPKGGGDIDMDAARARGATFEDLRRLEPGAQVSRARPQDVEGSPEQLGRGFRDFAVGGLVPMAVGPAAQALGAGHIASNAIAGAAGGAAQAAASGHPEDALTAALMGGAGQALAGGRGPREAHEPLTQAEIDAEALHRAPGKVEGIAEGEHGTLDLAQRANRNLDSRVAEREFNQGNAMDEAAKDYSSLDENLGPVPTFGAHARLGEIREQSMGGSKPTLASDPILRDYQENLGTPDGEMELPRGRLMNLQKGLNNEATFGKESRDPLANAALQQGAGVLSDRVRTADPREGPGNVGGALDRYGAEADALAAIEGLRGPESARVPRLAKYGAADKNSSPSELQTQDQVRELQKAEPAANDLIDLILARNTAERRKLQWSLPLYMSPENVAGSTGRNIARNASNLHFKLNPPMIDENGMVAAQRPGDMNQAIPLELQLLLMDKERQR